MKYFQSTIEKLLYLFLVLSTALNVAVCLIAYAGYKRQNELLIQQRVTLTALQNDFTSANTHIDCIFQYFSVQGRTSNSTVTLSPNEKICNVNINPQTTITTPINNGGSTKIER